ncbi:MAG: LPS export ABC transporter permease LptG [Proteobacteria bacterium]|nr:LPS export ABC transporter permease LptG [Pseudomonadota bacterium]
MNSLDRYLATTLAQAMLVASMGLVSFFVIFTFLEQLGDIENDYTMLRVAQFVAYSIPRMFYETLPFAVLIGCLTGLGVMASNSELVVMRAAGISTLRISMSTLKPALVFVLAGLLIGETVLPPFEKAGRLLRENAMEGTITTQAGFWYREGDEYLHFSGVDNESRLNGITRYRFENNETLTETLWADTATYVADEGYWLLSGVRSSRLAASQVNRQDLSELRWNTRLTPQVLKTEILVEPAKMSILELRRKIDYMARQGLNTGKFELGFWTKLFQPLASLSLVFVAISFIFGPLRESTMGMRVVSGLGTGILFKFIQDLLSPASLVFGFSPIIATLIPILICIALGAWLLRRAH